MNHEIEVELIFTTLINIEMRVVLLSIVLSIIVTCQLHGQEVSVAPSVYGVQLAGFGAYVYNESRIGKKLALRSELGIDGYYQGSSLNNVNSGFVLAPIITIEPRWYYKLLPASTSATKRDNLGSFVSLKASYNPDWFVLSQVGDLRIIDDITVIPSIGMRRAIGAHFNYELGLGFGYRHIVEENVVNRHDTAYDIHLRIGYKF